MFRSHLEKTRLLFSEVDRAARRLEELQETRRQRLAQLLRMRALEDEINQVKTKGTYCIGHKLHAHQHLKIRKGVLIYLKRSFHLKSAYLLTKLQLENWKPNFKP